MLDQEAQIIEDLGKLMSLYSRNKRLKESEDQKNGDVIKLSSAETLPYADLIK